jgi:phosphohistidine phosphatase
MKELLLLRHAKALAPDGADDYDRPLAPSGLADARRVGAHLASRGFEPSRILCSSAQRAVETLNGLREQLGGRPQLRIERELYLASAPQILSRLARLSERDDTVLVLGHNPGIEDLARALAGAGDRAALRRMAAQFPPAACAALEFDLNGWGDLALGGGRLAAFTTPRDVA